MLYLAKVLCLMLVATASPTSTQKLLDAALFSSQKYMDSNYDWLAEISEQSITTVLSRFSQLRAQANPNDFNVFECYKNYKGSYEDQRQNLFTAWEACIQRFDESKDATKSLASMQRKKLLDNVNALKRVKKIWRGSLNNVEQATSTLYAVYDETEKKIEACNDLSELLLASKLLEDRSSMIDSL